MAAVTTLSLLREIRDRNVDLNVEGDWFSTLPRLTARQFRRMAGLGWVDVVAGRLRITAAGRRALDGAGL